jgi:hypothetical protein
MVVTIIITILSNFIKKIRKKIASYEDLTLVTGFEPARPSFEGPTSQGHQYISIHPEYINTRLRASPHQYKIK